MTCRITEEQLWSWVDRDAVELQDHLDQCGECRDREAALRTAIRRVTAGVAQPPFQLPQRIATYDVKRIIGEGGQGVVFEVEQRSPRRRLALKVLKEGNPRRDGRGFQREVESLARLKHASIAAIHEAGHTETGRPFLAMEYVDGLSLIDWAAQHALSLSQRLDLFRSISATIAYAHQRGVIHRDLKPTNILVDADGTPHILDFGMARITDRDATLTFTLDADSRIQGTLPYMSPEQALGDAAAVDVRTDVYSLGVILYQLVCGRLPFNLRGANEHEALRAIREEPPRRPRSTDRALHHDLETIILKTLEKNPAHRYQTVSALADDVARYQRRESIHARPPTRSDQLCRLIVRHKWPFVATAAAFVLTAAFALFWADQAAHIARERDAALAARVQEAAARRDAEREKDRARLSAERSQRVREFLESSLLSADPRWTAGEASVRDLLDAAESRLDDGWAPDARLQGELRLTLARAFGRFGIPRKEFANYAAAVALLERSADSDRALLADACHEWASCLRRSDATQAASLFQRALDLRRDLYAADDPRLLATASALADLHVASNRLDLAEPLYLEILDCQSAGLSVADQRAAELHESISRSCASRSDFDNARSHLQAALNLYIALYGPRHALTARVLTQLGELAARLGDFDLAAEHFLSALDICRDLPDQSPNVILMLQNLGDTRRKAARPADALPFFTEALDIAQSSLPEWHYITLSCHQRYGECLFALGRIDEAAEQLEIACAGLRALAGDQHEATRSICATLAEWRAARLALKDAP